MTRKFSQEVVAAAKRVATILDMGCDRCDAADLELLERAGLMDVGVCNDTAGQDTLEIGETMWTFNEEGRALAELLIPNG